MRSLLFAVVVMLVTGCEFSSDLNNRQKEECGMWKLFNETNGQFGWPDVYNRFDKDCKVYYE